MTRSYIIPGIVNQLLQGKRLKIDHHDCRDFVKTPPELYDLVLLCDEILSLSSVIKDSEELKNTVTEKLDSLLHFMLKHYSKYPCTVRDCDKALSLPVITLDIDTLKTIKPGVIPVVIVNQLISLRHRAILFHGPKPLENWKEFHGRYGWLINRVKK